MLEFILEKGEASVSDMMKESLGSFVTLDGRLCQMEEDGVVEVRYPDSGRKARIYHLTDKGRAFSLLMRLGHTYYIGKLDIEDQILVEKVEDLLKNVDPASTEW
jgi:DNA-binding PadR family transcriptional regulator